MVGYVCWILFGFIKDMILNEQIEFFNMMCLSLILRDNLVDEVVLFCFD